MSDRQWAGMMLGDEAYAGSRNFYHLEAAIQRFYGYTHIVPTHQGRGAEHLISQMLIKPGDHIPGQHVLHDDPRSTRSWPAATFHDVIIDEAHDPQADAPVQGQRRPRQARGAHRRGRARTRSRTSASPGTVNMAGGQPVSMANVRELRALCEPLGIKVHARRDPHGRERAVHPGARGGLRGQDRSPRSCSSSAPTPTAPGCRAKKDNLVNIGGWLAVNDWDIFEELRNLVVVYEGLHTYGGLAGRDMEALAIGIEEAVQDEHVRSRVGPGAVPRRAARASGTSRSCSPIGGHAIFLDATAVLPAPRAGPVPGPDPGGGAVPRLRHPVDGAGHRRPPAATRRPATTSARSSS